MNFRLAGLVALGLAATIPLSACAPLDVYGSGPVGYDRGYDQGYGTGSGRYDQGYRGGPAVVLCESQDRRVSRCAVDTRGGVRLVQRESKAACVQGRSWGHDRRGIWVSNGCRARFELGGAYVAPGRSRGGDVVVCESIDERRNFCRVPGGARQVQLVRQLSDTHCRQNGNWGFQRGGIWVDRGCRAEFRVY